MIKIRETVICWVIFLAIISANLILGTVHVWAAGQTAVTANSKTDDTTVQRQELKNEIDKYSEKNAGKAVPAIKKLLSLENSDDVTYLLDIAAKNIKSPITKEIKKAILAYKNKEYLVTALKKAGQDKSADINVMAANLLIDMKEELKGLKVMVSLIKKGVIDKRVIDIMDRVPNRTKLNGVKVDGGKTIYNSEIQSELSWIGTTKTYPKEVQVFALLMQSAYYSSYLENVKELIWETLEKANHDYLLNAMTLLEKTLNISGDGVMVAENILRKLTTSKMSDIAQRASADIAKFEGKLKEEAKMTLLGKRDSELPQPDVKYSSVHYFSGAKATRADTEFLLRELEKNPDLEMRASIIRALGQKTQYEDIVLPGIKRAAQNGTSLDIRSAAINGLLNRGMEKDAFIYLKSLIVAKLKKGDYFPDWHPLERFKDKNVITDVRNYCNLLKKDFKEGSRERAYGAIQLYRLFGERNSENIKIIKRSIHSNDEGLIRFILLEIHKSAVMNYRKNEKQKINEDLDLFKDAIKSSNKFTSSNAKKQFAEIEKSQWFKDWNEGQRK